MALDRVTRLEAALEAAQINLQSVGWNLKFNEGRQREQLDVLEEYEQEHPEDNGSDHYKSIWREVCNRCYAVEANRREFKELEYSIKMLEEMLEEEKSREG